VTGFGGLLADLVDAGVSFVVVGGVAVISHGVVRATRDVDVVVAANLSPAVIEALVGRWDATRPDGSPEPRRRPSPGWPLHLRTTCGSIDLLHELPAPLDLAGLRSRATWRRVDGTEVLVCSLADLTAMKRLAGRPTDLEDLRRLETAHGQLPEPPESS